MHCVTSPSERLTTTEGPCVLIIDDDPSVLRAHARMLGTSGCRVETAECGESALRVLAANDVDVIVSDIELPGMSGIDFMHRVRQGVDADMPILLVTGRPELETATAAIDEGVLRYLTKPVATTVLVHAVHEAAQLHRVARANMEAVKLAGGYARLSSVQSGMDADFTRMLDTLFIAYQPIVSWSKREVFGYEALMRSRESALPHPGAMLAAAERLDRTSDLGRVVRARACAPVPSMAPATSLFVNLHTRDLLDEALFSEDAPLTQVASRVVLEITERAALDEIPDVQERVARLRGLGFRVAVDDLGAGYAGLTSFALLEPEIVKLDMSLVRDLHRQRTKRTLVRTMISMCKELGMAIIGEGVETTEERDALAELGCDLMQGYLFAKPGCPFPEPAL